ncbi:hypothetical protein [Antrihabitans spumae]|uniref:Uncharacterized protein n=1 Tax=Antrihabitans spumae TaxID=3373370 RepID=A0ABW7K168_9NOCA
MTATSPSRGISARLLAVLAVLAGLALAQGLQCRDGMPAMSLPGSMPQSVMYSAPADTDASDDADLVTGAFHIVKAAADAAGEPMALGGVLAACLVAVLTWLAASTLRLRRTSVAVGCPIRAGPSRAAHAALPRAPTLAQLCVLRT